MSKQDTKLLVEDIVESADKILIYTKDLSFDQFSNDSLTIDAVIRNFEIIGEAANRLPKDFKDKYSSIEWYRIMGFRNRIIHDYFGIDYSIVWQIKESFLPVLITLLKQIVF